jgi:hypothetical protein
MSENNGIIIVSEYLIEDVDNIFHRGITGDQVKDKESKCYFSTTKNFEFFFFCEDNDFLLYKDFICSSICPNAEAEHKCHYD